VSLRQLGQDLRLLPREAWFLFAGTFLNRFGSFVVPFLILYLRREGYSIAQAGLVSATYGIGFLLANVFGGYVTDRFGRRNAIVFSMLSGAASLLALSQARGLPSLIFFTILAGLTAELYRPASSALLTDLVPPERRVIAFSAYRLAINAGFAAGPATAGFLANKSFLYLFVGDAITSVLYGIVALFFLPNITSGIDRAKVIWGESLPIILRDRVFLLFLLASMLNGFILMQDHSSFALHVQAAGFPASTYGLLVSMNGLIIVLIELPLTAWTQKHARRAMIAFGYLLVGAGFAVNAFAYDIPLMMVGIVIWTFGEMIASPIAAAFVADMAPEALRGRYMGFYGLSWALGLIVGPALGPIIFAKSPVMIWSLCGLAGLAAAAIIWRLPTARHEGAGA
jgi:MFS family permease